MFGTNGKNDPLAANRDAAKSMWDMMTVFMEAGFERDEAFRIVMQVLMQSGTALAMEQAQQAMRGL